MTDGDDIAPTARAGADPLLAFPKESTGTTGQIERPGDQTPWWFVPGLCAVAVFFIGLLATISNDRASDRAALERSASEEAAAAAEVTGADAGGTGGADTTSSSTTPEQARLADLPAPGVIRVGGTDFFIESRCEVILPLDPADTEFQVSSYLYYDTSRSQGLVDRVFDGRVDRARLLDGSTFQSLEEIGDAGAFAAEFRTPEGDTREVLVNPATDTEPACGDRVVTAEPGQFTEPHAWIVLDVCIDRSSSNAIAGLTSEGARFEILQPGGELGEIVFQDPGGRVFRTAAPASILRSGDITSASGVVTDGPDSLDITVDIGVETTETAARDCSPSDRIQA